MLDISSVGQYKIEYKDHKHIDFEPLSFYLNLAEKTISKFAPPSVSRKMLKSDDAISSVANAIMMADWRWDDTRIGSGGQKKTHYSYRNQCAIWAVKSYISRKNNKKNRSNCIDISIQEDLCILDILQDKIKNPLSIAIENEERKINEECIGVLIDPSNNILSQRQYEYIRLYYMENLSFAEIGKRFNITREAVRQSIKKSLDRLKKMVTNV